MDYQYISDIPATRNFIDIEGPDGMVSHEDVLRSLAADSETRRLAEYLIDRWGGPDRSESAVDMAIRLLESLRA